MNAVKLNVIDRTEDRLSGQSVVIFQKNSVKGPDETAIAWKVIQNSSLRCDAMVYFPCALEVGAIDEWGNEIGVHLPAEPGSLLRTFRDSQGDHLACVGSGSNPDEIQLRNDFPFGAVTACIHRDGRALAKTFNLPPCQNAAFKFEPTLWMGVVSDVRESDLLNSAIIENITTCICLTGIQSADIVITGRKENPWSRSYEFTLDNIIYEKQTQPPGSNV